MAKHKHHILIGKWNENNALKLQHKDPLVVGSTWKECTIYAVIAKPYLSYRVAPRDFQVGHWYPCKREGRSFFAIWTGTDFSEPVNDARNLTSIIWSKHCMEIGESLGEIKFGE